METAYESRPEGPLAAILRRGMVTATPLVMEQVSARLPFNLHLFAFPEYYISGSVLKVALVVRHLSIYPTRPSFSSVSLKKHKTKEIAEQASIPNFPNAIPLLVGPARRAVHLIIFTCISRLERLICILCSVGKGQGKEN
jgi:hypothetical protein